jgi:hypothetical protein
MIGKYVYQNVGGPEINLTYLTLDDLQQLMLKKCLQNEICNYEAGMMLDYIVVRYDFPDMWIIMRQDLQI